MNTSEYELTELILDGLKNKLNDTDIYFQIYDESQLDLPIKARKYLYLFEITSSRVKDTIKENASFAAYNRRYILKIEIGIKDLKLSKELSIISEEIIDKINEITLPAGFNQFVFLNSSNTRNQTEFKKKQLQFDMIIPNYMR